MLHVSSLTSSHILVIEPNTKLETPYEYLHHYGSITRVTTIEKGMKEIIRNIPSLVFISASIEPSDSYRVLDVLKDVSRYTIIPIIIVVDLNQEISFVLGTSWGGKIAIIDNYIPKRDLISTISRVS